MDQKVLSDNNPSDIREMLSSSGYGGKAIKGYQGKREKRRTGGDDALI
jgi:hypothetical protein